MDYISNKSLLLLILNFIITEENNLKCVTNEIYDFENKADIKISIENFKFLDKILKKHENDTIDLIMNGLDLPNLEYVKIYNYSINKLDLSDNYIQAFPEDFFSSLKFIKEINFKDNSILDLKFFYRNIEINLCAFLYLEKIDLGFNNISSLNGNNFDKLKNLKVLNLDHNQIKMFSTFDLNKFNRVKELRLGNIEMIIDEDLSFRNFLNLDLLDLSYCILKSLNSNIFAGLKNLSSLDLFGINLSNLTENIFFEFKNLKNLSLVSVVKNKKQFLNIFSYFPARNNLELLDISENSLISLDDLNLNQFSKLKYLDLSHNNIRKINQTSFNGMKELRCVYLEWNDVESLSFDLFFEENKIEVFWISHNKIKKVKFDFFKEAKRLRILDLSYTNLDSLSQICFTCMTNLTQVYLWSNNISKVPNFAKNINLEYIGLHFNNIQIIQSNAFYNLSKLKTIDFEGNPIKLVEPNAFYNCNNLEIIWLPIHNLTKDVLYNLLESLNNIVVDNTINVKYFNSMQVINSDIIDSRFCILMIYFLRYRVTFIPKEFFYNVPHQEDSSINMKRVFYYSEELTVQYFMNNCLNLSIFESDKF